MYDVVNSIAIAHHDVLCFISRVIHAHGIDIQASTQMQFFDRRSLEQIGHLREHPLICLTVFHSIAI